MAPCATISASIATIPKPLPHSQRCRPVVRFESEMARTLQDVLRRRIPLLLTASGPEETVTEVAGLAAETLRWPDLRIRHEIDTIVRPHTALAEVDPV